MKSKICKPDSRKRGRSDSGEHGALHVEVGHGDESGLTVQSQAICLSQFQYVPMILSVFV